MADKKKEQVSSCDICAYYSYDDDYECYTCEIDLDEDEMYQFVTDRRYSCPYFKMGDEYLIVRKQM